MLKHLSSQIDRFRTYRLKHIVAFVLRILRIVTFTTKKGTHPQERIEKKPSSSDLKLCLVDHSYHFKTASSSFFRDIMAETGNTDLIWDSKWNGGSFPPYSRLRGKNYDVLAVFQTFIYHAPANIKKTGAKKIFIIPMYDDARTLPDHFLRRYSDFRFISFSNTYHERLRKLGINSRYFRYFIDPSLLQYREDDFNSLRGFFWQRTNDITWPDIKKLIENRGFEKFHLHIALDPIWYKAVLPSDEEMKKYNVTVTNWFDRKKDYYKAIAKSNIVFLPRTHEGIGMPMMEAMSMGKVVVAANNPTMNEYIRHGVNGLLYDIMKPEPLDFKRAREIAENARSSAFENFTRWQHDRQNLLEWIRE